MNTSKSRMVWSVVVSTKSRDHSGHGIVRPSSNSVASKSFRKLITCLSRSTINKPRYRGWSLVILAYTPPFVNIFQPSDQIIESVKRIIRVSYLIMDIVPFNRWKSLFTSFEQRFRSNLREVDRRKTFRLGAGERWSILIMSTRTLSVAVAVTAITGTDGYSDLKNESCLNEGRKSWPHSSRFTPVSSTPTY